MMIRIFHPEVLKFDRSIVSFGNINFSAQERTFFDLQFLDYREYRNPDR